jgi:hypothetical protein
MNEVKVVAYDDFRAKIDSVKEMCHFLPDVSNDEGYQKSKRVSLDVGKLLTGLEKCRKEAKADALEFGRRIDSEAKEIAAELEGFQAPHKEAYKKLDNEKKEREAKRKAELERRVGEMRSLPELLRESDSESVKGALESLAVEECLDFYEYTEQALKARNASKEALTQMFAVKLKEEADARELAELRRKQAEQEQKDRDARIAKEAADKAKTEAEAIARAEAERTKKAAEAAQHEQERLLREKEESEQRAAQAKKDAEKAAKEAEERAKKQAEEAVKRERDRIAKEQRQAEEEQERREANKRHVSSIRKQAKESIMALGYSEQKAKDLVVAIHNGNVKNVFIKY